MTFLYRPWGLLDWLLKASKPLNWNLFGCIGTESRSLTVWQYLTQQRAIAGTRLLQIAHRPSRYDSLIQQKMAKRIDEFRANNGNETDIRQHALLEAYSLIVSEVEEFLSQPKESVLLDVTSFPKRFFFPILKLLLRDHNIKNLLVTYTHPEKYASEKLAENPLEWDHLPLFSGKYSSEKPKMLVAGIGFEAFGLQGQIDQGDSGVPVKLLLPFPCSPNSYRRGLDMVRKLQKHRSPGACEVYRTDSKDVSDSFDRLVSLSQNGNQRIVLAPFGPKPISVAMCVFASLTDSAVYYTLRVPRIDGRRIG